MRSFSSIILTGALLAVAAPAAADSVAPPTGTHLVPGYYDPKTGTFKPIVHHNPSELSPNATTNVGGKFIINFTIGVASAAVTTSTPIYCSVDISTDDADNYIDEDATVTATRKSATAATCTVTIPFAWYHLTTPKTDAVSISYTLSAGTYNASAGSFGFDRSSSQTIVVLPSIPANGSTTTESLAATI